MISKVVRFVLAIALFTAFLPIPSLAQQVVTLPAEDRPVASEGEEVYRVGALDGEPWETFGELLEMAFDSQGRLFVLDRHSGLVHAFSPEGAHLWTNGGLGGGPQELSRPQRLRVAADGTPVASDPGRQAIRTMDPETGRMTGSVPLPDGLVVQDVFSGPDATLHLLPSERTITTPTIPIFRLPLDGGSTDIVLEVEPESRETVTRSEGMRRRELPPAFSPRLRVTGAGGDLFVVQGGAYEVRWLSGGEERTIRRALSPRPVTSRDRAAVRDQMLAQAGGGTVQVGGFQVSRPTREEVEARFRSLRFAETLPVIAAVAGGPDGTLWIGRYGAVAPGAGPVDVVRSGRYLGTLAPMVFPEAVGPDGLVAWLEEGEAGVPQIVVRRIVVGG